MRADKPSPAGETSFSRLPLPSRKPSLIRFLKASYFAALSAALLLLLVFVLRLVSWRAFAEDREISERIAQEAAALAVAGLELAADPAALVAWNASREGLEAAASRAGWRSGFSPAGLEELRGALVGLGRGAPGPKELLACLSIMNLALEANERRESFFVRVGTIGTAVLSSLFVFLGLVFFRGTRRLRKRIEWAIPAIGLQIEAMAAGAFGAPPIGGEDEPGRISEAIAAASLSIAAARRELEAERDRSAALLEERERLFRELVHRVKNNYAVMASLVELQRREAPGADPGEALAELGGRIRSIAVLHDHLDAARGSGSVYLRPFLSELIRGLVGAMTAGPGEVALSLEVGEESLEYRRAKTVGLIVNELATNSLKHALPSAREAGRPLAISVGLRPAGESWRLSFRDDGPGYAMDSLERRRLGGADGRPGTSGIGLELVRSFCADLGGEARFSSEGGASLEVDFPRVPRS
ncbi:MAG TPA: sensor histidine kinase [Spirochaetales bacterium]|nr:sensor histidine kinase [Spirochaetales bacterium]HRY55146.1 sensor histidine kinase [Spirochaetia bacterium]HRZ66330.1 sensor histidine kinase [Spirochaetia bacterium]